ncbi:MAG: hypothetical protein QM831_03935 [Kofleriaceae bacterium]
MKIGLVVLVLLARVAAADDHVSIDGGASIGSVLMAGASVAYDHRFAGTNHGITGRIGAGNYAVPDAEDDSETRYVDVLVGYRYYSDNAYFDLAAGSISRRFERVNDVDYDIHFPTHWEHAWWIQANLGWHWDEFDFALGFDGPSFGIRVGFTL